MNPSLGCISAATIAIGLHIDDVAPKSREGPVFSSQIQRDRGYCESLLNSSFIVVLLVLKSVSMPGTDQQPSRNDHSERRPHPFQRQEVREYGTAGLSR
jgi:hypothetical protein